MSDRPLRLDDQLCFALYAATNAVTRAYRPLLARLGLTYSQYLVMLVLWERGPRSIAGLATELRLPPNALTPVVTRLADSGYVRREADPADGRVRRVTLTGPGRDLHDAAREAQAEVTCRTALDPDELTALREQLHDMTRRLDGAASSAGGGPAVTGAEPAPQNEGRTHDQDDYRHPGGGPLRRR